MSAAVYAGPIAVTVAYLVLYYAFVIRVAIVKAARERALALQGEKFDRYFGQDREMLAADRLQLNTLEQMPPFLVLLWMNAVFVGPGSATAAGVVYVVARAAYPFMLGARVGRGIRARVLAATLPGYLVIVWFVGALGWAVLQG